ncbi:MAG: glutamine synthetase [Actinobacteria bacterium]|nr:glutamine synthetase [Actinomycetota bacterium]
MSTSQAPLSLDQLTAAIHAGEIDTVIVAITDMQGRLQGKRLDAHYFLSDVLAHGTEGCNYLIAVDIDMNTVSGYDISSWDTGYGDMVMDIDLNTLRLVDWHEGTAIILADLKDHHGNLIDESPRSILQNQLQRLKDMGMIALVGTELEFILFNDTYEEAWDSRYNGLTPSNQYNVDYSITGTSRVEPLLRRIRRSMTTAGLVVESVKGECNLGQHEIAFKYTDALATCDNHVIYKTAAKEIAAQDGYALTFMAKFNEREGNSCHIHLSFRGLKDEYVLADDSDPDGLSQMGKHFIAGQLKHMRELSALYAPTINSYKRYQPGSFAPTAIKWGRDNRTCSYRLVGHGPSLRVENRVPGGDVNPYLAVAGMIAAGIDGIEQKLELEPRFDGNAYALESDRVPHTLQMARDLWANSDWAQKTFGAKVHKHYLRQADVELEQFNRAITDWERIRGFERY